jgi:hypothetical protein
MAELVAPGGLFRLFDGRHSFLFKLVDLTRLTGITDIKPGEVGDVNG